MADNFQGTQGEVSGPATRLFAITPHDSNPLVEVTRTIHVNTDGTVACRALNSATDVTLTVKAGVAYPYRLSHVRATGTTATLAGAA